MYAINQGEGDGGHRMSPPARAFVVEDDLLLLRLLSEVAADVGLEPMAFTRLSEARRAMERRIPSVLVVDDDLPDGKGADFVRELRANPATRHVTVVFCTAAGPARKQEISRLAPVVTKPFALADIERALREAVGAPGRHATGR